jgi:hypothetical protein
MGPARGKSDPSSVYGALTVGTPKNEINIVQNNMNNIEVNNGFFIGFIYHLNKNTII